ncbi:hypothetical protein X949_4034 [Burkholderia pseudomallei MSHR5609]|nr:hypothetical protein X992_4337 [Burkholderia pseudomallei MSHR5492]KGS56927.1 hypothetical protein X949_4034 [Burkholderia pseudomallei MSHR5609]
MRIPLGLNSVPYGGSRPGCSFCGEGSFLFAKFLLAFAPFVFGHVCEDTFPGPISSPRVDRLIWGRGPAYALTCSRHFLSGKFELLVVYHDIMSSTHRYHGGGCDSNNLVVW